MKSYQTSLQSIFYLPLKNALSNWRSKETDLLLLEQDASTFEMNDIMELGQRIHMSVAEIDTIPEQQTFPFLYSNNKKDIESIDGLMFPGTELDDREELIGSEDEENNYYSFSEPESLLEEEPVTQY
ncbi:MAG: hypothetical protein ACOYKE_09445 [Ferruginibacter sp.]